MNLKERIRILSEKAERVIEVFEDIKPRTLVSFNYGFPSERGPSTFWGSYGGIKVLNGKKYIEIHFSGKVKSMKLFEPYLIQIDSITQGR